MGIATRWAARKHTPILSAKTRCGFSDDDLSSPRCASGALFGDCAADYCLPRETLYKEMWEEPTSSLAKRCISDVGLAKDCRNL